MYVFKYMGYYVVIYVNVGSSQVSFKGNSFCRVVVFLVVSYSRRNYLHVFLFRSVGGLSNVL